MDTTAVSWKVRGLKLRAVDDALESYWKSGQQKTKQGQLRRALDEWIKDLGANWQANERNTNQIVSLLRATLNEQQFTPEDIVAFQFQDEQRRLRMQRIFRGKEIVWKAFSNTSASVRTAIKRLEDAKKGNGGELDDDQEEMLQRMKARNTYQNGKWSAARGVANGIGTPALDILKMTSSGVGASSSAGSMGMAGGSEFKKMVGELFGGVHSIKDIDFHLLRETGLGVDDMAASVAPIISNITSGVNLLIAWGKLAKAVYSRRDIGSQKSFVASGDIGKAFEALEELLDRKVKAESVTAAIQTADFSARAAASCIDFGAVSGSLIGCISALSKLVQKLYLLGREYFETRAARALLDTGVIDCRLFNAYPLMGCYMLACSDLSEIIVMTRNEQAKLGVLFGVAGWMDDVEEIKKNHIDPVLKKAASFIFASPFSIPDMPLHVAHDPDLFNKLGNWDGKYRFLANSVRMVSGVA